MSEKTEKPIRVQLSRKKGWRMPPNTVKVDRTTRYGNPFPKYDPKNPDYCAHEKSRYAERANPVASPTPGVGR